MSNCGVQRTPMAAEADVLDLPQRSGPGQTLQVRREEAPMG
jgi:hypothetical protein